MDEHYPSNSNASKSDGQNSRAKSVVKTSATIKPKSKLSESFIAEDMKTIGNYVLNDIIIPSTKKAISDIISKGINMLLYGNTNKASDSSTVKVSYRSYYNNQESQVVRPQVSSKNDFDCDRIIFRSREDAEAVLSAMDDILEKYSVVTVGDLYDLAEITTTNYMINKYGWTDIRAAKVMVLKEGYQISLPKPMPID